jgi:hypothetical protein
MIENIVNHEIHEQHEKTDKSIVETMIKAKFSYVGISLLIMPYRQTASSIFLELSVCESKKTYL